MGFLDNSGDIILDAVLTDAGRQRLARGDGSFRITQFALGDDEINYGLYDKENEGGSAYYDLEIMQTPIFEAFTNNIASLNSRLISFSRTNLLYLPVMKVNQQETPYANSSLVKDGFALAVDEETENFIKTSNLQYDGNSIGPGVLYGQSVANSPKFIRVDQGIDNAGYPAAETLESDLVETQFLIEIDNRFASLVAKDATSINVSYVDDDDMAAYYISIDDGTIAKQHPQPTDKNDIQTIKGAKGNIVEFKLKASVDVSTTDYLFDRLGTDISSNFTFNTDPITETIKSINASVRITGLTTGYSIDIPLVLLKKI